MMRVVGLKDQKNLRDLAGLPRVCDEVAWLDAEALAKAAEPAIIVGLWLADDPSLARRTLASRSESGLVTIVVPRFKSGDLQAVLRAPSAIRVKIGEFETFNLEDGSTLKVAGQTVLDTALHIGQWGTVDGQGVAVLGYRPHEAAGATALCMPGLVSRQFGVDVGEQQRLLELIVSKAAVKKALPAKQEEKTEEPTDSPLSIDELLQSDDPHAVSVALLLAVNGNVRDAAALVTASDRLGVQLTDETISRTLGRMKPTTTDELETALRQHGWAHSCGEDKWFWRKAVKHE